jgi:hypothetical protein
LNQRLPVVQPGALQRIFANQFIDQIGVQGFSGFSKHQFPGAFEKDKLPALILAGAPGAFRLRVLAIQMPDKFHLAAEARRASDFLLLILLQSFHSSFYFATFPKSFQDFLAVFAVAFGGLIC